MITLRKTARLLAALLALAMLIPGTSALADSDFQAVVSSESMNVYGQKAPHSLLGALPRGTVVTVKAYSGEAALISYGDRQGVVHISDLSPASSANANASDAQSSDAGTPMVANRKTRLYKKPSVSSSYTTVKSGASLTLLAVNGNCARVSLNGKTGYMVYSHLSEPGAVQEAEAAPAVAPTPTAAVKTGSLPVVTTREAKVCANADGTGGSVLLDKGTKLTLLAVKGECAMVEKNGAIGYMQTAYLQKETASEEKAEETKAADSNPFAAGSNERTIYSFLTGEMHLNRAAAMGVMANIKYESSYRPTEPGDGGTSYGICQWHAGRKTNLINWCQENGLDYTTLEAQLKFLKHELAASYPSVNSYLKQVENTADGAYDAGYYFCFNFEAPAARTSQSTKRGNYAKDTLFPMK